MLYIVYNIGQKVFKTRLNIFGIFFIRPAMADIAFATRHTFSTSGWWFWGWIGG